MSRENQLNSVENSERAPENARIFSKELGSQMSRKLEVMKTSLNSQILQAIEAVISEKVNLLHQQRLWELEERFKCQDGP